MLVQGRPRIDLQDFRLALLGALEGIDISVPGGEISAERGPNTAHASLLLLDAPSDAEGDFRRDARLDSNRVELGARQADRARRFALLAYSRIMVVRFASSSGKTRPESSVAKM